MATRSALEKDYIVLITDLSSNSTRSIHPALGRITGFLDPDSKSQAIVQYSNGKVDRPISKLVVVVRADEQIPDKGKCFCPIAEKDEQVQKDDEKQEDGLPDHGDLEAAASLPDGDQPYSPVLPPRPEGLLPQPVERPPPRQVVVEEEKDEDKDVLTIRQRPDTSAGQEALPSRPRRQKRPLSKF